MYESMREEQRPMVSNAGGSDRRGRAAKKANRPILLKSAC